jgi:hypothetical protein
MKAKRNLEGRTTRVDDGTAFLPDMVADPEPGTTSSAADAEFFGEEYIGAATTGQSQSQAASDEVVDEEEGGPFIVLGEDGSLPPDDSAEHEAIEAEGHEPIAQAQLRRGARWAANGA